MKEAQSKMKKWLGILLAAAVVAGAVAVVQKRKEQE